MKIKFLEMKSHHLGIPLTTVAKSPPVKAQHSLGTYRDLILNK